MKKGMLALFATLLLVSLTIGTRPGYASTQDDIDRQLAQIKQQEADLAQKKADADKQQTTLKTQQTTEQKNLDTIRAQLDEEGAKLNDLNKQLNDTTLQLKQAGADLDDAQARVDSRDQQLKSRVRLMYMSGGVSYLDVLLSATSFSDFLDRYYALQTIVGQDKTILEANKKDRDLIAAKKQQIEQQMAQMQTLVAQAEQIKASLADQEKQKQVAIASLSKKLQDDDNVSQDAEDQLIQLAKQKQKLLEQQRELNAKSSSKPQPTFAYSGGKLAWPVPSSHTISDVFGMRIDPIKHIRKLHAGMDIAAPAGSTIVAAEDGVVLISGWVNGYGNTVIIDHGNGLWTLYGHIRNGWLKVQEGETVKRGQKIAEVGSTGDSTGNHCHFEVRVNQVATDPTPYLK